MKPFFHIVFQIGISETQSLLLYSNYTVYLGEVQLDKSGCTMRHGKGKLSYSNGDTFEGEFRHNLNEGFCRYTYQNGDVYTAEYYQGYPRNGTSRVELSSGEIIENT